jgi:carbonic anhydrase
MSFYSLTPLVLNADGENCECDTSNTNSAMYKFDPSDHALEGLLENNRKWAAAVMKEDPDFFSNIAHKQEPKILWIGK